MERFNYSIIRYMPNPKRGEIVNLGLVIFKENGLDIKILDKSSKANMLDSNINYDEILGLKEKFNEIATIIKNPDDQYRILKNFGYGLFLSEKASFSVNPEENETYETAIIELYDDLVKLPSRKKEASHSRIQTVLRKKFEQLNLFSLNKEEIKNHKVIQNYRLDNYNSELTADFMLKNGKYHITEIVDFNVNNKNEKTKEACLKSMIFSESQRILGEELGTRYFVYSASQEKKSEMTSSLNFVRKNCEKMFNLELPEEESKYFDEIIKLAKV